MNYFEFYDLTVQFKLDKKQLKRKFLQNSKKYHPDFHTMASQQEQNKVLELASLNNEAYQTLSDDFKCLRYVLELKGLVGEGIKQNLPPRFLMEMMAINEQIMELKFEPDPSTKNEVNHKILDMEKRMKIAIDPILGRYKESASKQKDLNQILNFYLKNQYLKRLRENLKQVRE